jgi:predicted DNA-binding transcriptional regulator AlpA
MRDKGEDKITKKQVIPRTNRISKQKKGAISVGDANAHGAVETALTPDLPTSLAPGRGPSARGPPDSAVYITAPQLLLRFGGMSDMWLVRMLERDSTFPRPYYFGGKRRFFKLSELESWERASAVKASWGKPGRPRKERAA